MHNTQRRTQLLLSYDLRNIVSFIGTYFIMYHVCIDSKAASEIATGKVVTRLDYTTLYSYQLKVFDASLDFGSSL